MKWYTTSCDRPSKSSASGLGPSSVSKMYSFSTATQGSSLTLARQLVAHPGVLLLAPQQLVPCGLPVGAADNLAVCHVVLLRWSASAFLAAADIDQLDAGDRRDNLGCRAVRHL